MAEPPRVAELDFAAIFDALPTPYAVLDADLVIVAVNRAREQATGRRRQDSIGRPLLEAFPDDPADPGATGVTNLRASLQRVLATARTDVMPVQRYDVDTGGGFQRRWWSPVNAPVLDDQGRVALILHRVEDVTEIMEGRRPAVSRGGSPAAPATVGHDVAQTDLWVRGHELRAALDAEAVATERLAGLVRVATGLATTDDVGGLTELVFSQGLAVIGADAATMAVYGPDGELEFTFTDSLPGRSRQAIGRAGSRTPAAAAATSGIEVVLPDRGTAESWSPSMGSIAEATGLAAWAALPLVDGGRIGSLTIAWREAQQFTERDLGLLRAFAGLCAQTLARIRAQEQEHEREAAQRDLAGALQRSLLTAPFEPDHLSIAVRYLPATRGVQVGGDWYDCFLTADGATTLVIGDVTGHDRHAAARMAQFRNMLRAICVTGDPGPASAVASLDRASRTLAVGAFATVVVARVESPADASARGLRTLRWTNAGHLPPALIPPAGPVELLSTPPELLLGLVPTAERSDHTRSLEPDSTVVLYTDGLVETRDLALAEGLGRLVQDLESFRHLPAEELCDVLVARVGEHHDDDVALLVLRVYPEEEPRPPEAGPASVPEPFASGEPARADEAQRFLA